jgi:hypothetical protein
MTRRRTAVRSLGAGALLTALAARPAEAHGLAQRADLPLPEWLFAWTAGVVLVVSFLALALLWPRPRLERPSFRPLPGALGRLPSSRAVRAAAGAVGVLLLAVTVVSGLAGQDDPQQNFAPTFVYVVVWVGVALASLLLGDVFRAVNPWLALGRLVERVVRRGRPARPYPERLGHWPAVIGLAGFAWLELASGRGEEPRVVAVAALVYTAVTLAAMAVYGASTWADRGEAFGVYFGLLGRVAPLTVRDGRLGTCPPLSGLAAFTPRAGTIALLAVLIGSTTFDGFSAGALWADAEVELTAVAEGAGLGLDAAAVVAATIGLAAGVLLVAGFYALGAAGARTVAPGLSAARLRRGFVHSLVPIAVVYVAAHYLTFLVFQGQAMAYLASDPLGRGWDLFGTAGAAIDFSVLSQNATWYLQVAFVVAGHVAALVLAHDRALVVFDDARVAVRSQLWMLVVMVGFTTLALWLLATANA